MTQEFETNLTTTRTTWNDETFVLRDFVPKSSRYQLALDEKAAVTQFRAQVGERVIDAVVKEKKQAKQEFQEAVEAGKNAYLAEQERDDIFVLVWATSQ